jgi:hypothetical protein
MRKLLLPLLGLLLMLPAYAQGVYEWEDEDGQKHFSDMPREGAKEVDLAPAQTFSAPALAASSATANSGSQGSSAADEVSYNSLEISSPQEAETIWNTGGQITVKVSLTPGLEMGHQIRLYMDGQQLADLPPRSNSVQLSDVPRGEHQLTAEILDENGKPLISSPVRNFMYHQTSVNRR